MLSVMLNEGGNSFMPAPASFLEAICHDYWLGNLKCHTLTMCHFLYHPTYTKGPCLKLYPSNRKKLLRILPNASIWSMKLWLIGQLVFYFLYIFPCGSWYSVELLTSFHILNIMEGSLRTLLFLFFILFLSWILLGTKCNCSSGSAGRKIFHHKVHTSLFSNTA